MTAKIKIYAKAYEETVDLSLVTEKCVSYDFVYSGQHLGERKLTVEVESPIEIEFAIGDFAFLDLYGSSEKFFLHAIPIGNRVHNSLMVKYSLTFWWRGYELKTIAFLDYVDGNESADAYNRNTGEVYVTGTIVQLMDRIKANMGRAYADGWYGTWDYDIHTSVDDTITKDISLENQYCWDALLLVKSLFGIDYRFSYDDRVILVGHPPEQVYDDYNSENLNFQFGKDKGLCEITRLENTEQLVTRVFAYGSTRNISPTYRSADFEHGYSPRLMLPAIEAPNGYLSNAGLEAIYGIREAFYINDEIYPSIEGLDNTIKAVDVINDRPDGYSGYKPQYETVIVKEEENYDYYDAEYDQHVYIHIPQEVKKVLIPTENFDIFTVYISGTLPNITNENINAGKTAKMLFTTGLLAGNTFEITSYEEHMTLIDGQPMWNDGFGNQYYKVTLKRINNDDNYFLPNGTIKPSAGDETTPGDKFVFVDIFMPVDYEAAAEYALYEDTLNWLAQHSGIPMAYFIRIPEEFIERYINIQYWLRESVLAKITDTILNADATYLIQSITISWKKENLLPTYDLTLADKPIKSRIHLLESNLKSASAVAATNNYNTNKQISNMEKSATINFNRVFNNNWDINGNYIAPQSVQINSQSIELKSTRYILQAYFTVNYLGNANSARGTEGVLIHKDADVVWGGIYDLEHQTWTIAAPQTFTLETEKYYWVYIKCSLVNGSAIWVVSEIKILAQELEGYYMFEWGQINPSIGDYRFSQNEHGVNGIDSFVYIAYGSSLGGDDFTMVNNPALEYMAIKSTTSVIVTPVVGDFDGLWFRRKGDNGDGLSNYTYFAYASDNTGTGWSLTPTDLLKYRAEIHSATILTPVEADFAGATWVKYIGDDGIDGTDGEDGAPGAPGVDGSDANLSAITPLTVSSDTVNETIGDTHTHELGLINIDKVVSGEPMSYGALYNHYVTTDIRKISSSDDWVIPALADFIALDSYVNPIGKLKITGVDDWDAPNTGAINAFEFSAKGTGYRIDVFSSMKIYCFMWTTNTVSTFATAYVFRYNNDEGATTTFSKGRGSTISLIKDATGVTDGTKIQYIGNNRRVYEGVAINGKYWIINLNETKFRDGSWITGYDGGVYTPILDEDWELLTTEAMCYYDDDEANGGGEILLDAEFHNPVTIHPDSAAFASIDANQVLNIYDQTGRAGESAFVYIAYASASDGTGFTLTFNSSLDYIAILSTTAEILTPVVSDFAGLWKKYKGEPGEGASHDPVTLNPASAAYGSIGTDQVLTINAQPGSSLFTNGGTYSYLTDTASRLLIGYNTDYLPAYKMVINGQLYTTGNIKVEVPYGVLCGTGVLSQESLFLKDSDTHSWTTGHGKYSSKAGKPYYTDGAGVEYDLSAGTASFQVLTAKDIEAGTAQAYDLIIKCRQEITITAIVVECDNGTLTGCTVTIGATAITFSSGTFSVSTTLTEIAATANNVASAGARVKINTTTGYTGAPTVLNVQLNYTAN